MYNEKKDGKSKGGKKVYYAVKRGRKVGIFMKSKDVAAVTDGFLDACHQSFALKEDALSFLGIQYDTVRDLVYVEKEQTLYFCEKPDVLNIYVDGSYNDKKKVHTAAFLAMKEGKTLHKSCELYQNHPYDNSLKSNVGEIESCIAGLRYACKEGAKNVLIYHDNELIGDMLYANKRSTNPFLYEYVEFVKELREKHGMYIDFIKVKSHNGNEWNQEVDKLAHSFSTGTTFDQLHAFHNGICSECEQRCDKKMMSLQNKKGQLQLLCMDCENQKDTIRFYIEDSFVKHLHAYVKQIPEKVLKETLLSFPKKYVWVKENKGYRTYWSWKEDEPLLRVHTKEDGRIYKVDIRSKDFRSSEIVGINQVPYIIVQKEKVPLSELSLSDYHQRAPIKPEKITKRMEFIRDHSKRLTKQLYAVKKDNGSLEIRDGVYTFLAAKELGLHDFHVQIVKPYHSCFQTIAERKKSS